MVRVEILYSRVYVFRVVLFMPYFFHWCLREDILSGGSQIFFSVGVCNDVCVARQLEWEQEGTGIEPLTFCTRGRCAAT